MLHAGEGEAEATLHQGALFALILFARLDVDQFGAKIDYRKVVFEKMLGYLNPGGYLILSGTETGYRTKAAEKIRPNIFRKTN